MTDHCSEELSALLSGELGREETYRVVAHLRECGECTGELVSVAVAHGSLRAARRAEESLSPDPDARVRETLRDQPPLRLSRARTHRWPYLGAAAALLAVVAIGLGLVLGHTSRPPVYAVATLHHMDAPATATGRVTVRATSRVKEMGVVTTGLPALPANHYYEVWLLQPQTNKMLPVGLLPPSGQGTYAVSGAIMSQYSAVDISLQTNDGNPVHSKFSVLRGTVVPVVS
jgi:anti-sigma-K factor RskA